MNVRAVLYLPFQEAPIFSRLPHIIEVRYCSNAS